MSAMSGRSYWTGWECRGDCEPRISIHYKKEKMMHLMDAEAWCTDCDWKTKGRNAMGNAARHHKKTGHYVQMELYFSQTFGEPHQAYLKKSSPTPNGEGE